MTAEGTTASSPEELVVSVEQANALIDLIGIREGYNALSSVIPVSGLISAGLGDSNGLVGDVEAILGPARTVDSRLAIRVVSPRPSIGVRNVRIWPSQPRSVVMRAEDDGVHFTQVDFCDVPHILAEESLLAPGPTIHDGPPSISVNFVQAVRDVDLERAQSALIDVAAQGPSESHFSQDCWHKRWCVVLCVREERTRDRWKDAGHVECFVTDHMHAQIHAPIDPRALALMRERNAPTLDAPPRTALWGFLMELLAK
ncbi:XRE family transcriptional regulator [uncultured Actinomyces sp.]|uniref:XRE family transcriptional regulator n=1 Tax=uncultured Actinomyces sp. TaxID=249061 RepID=UPI001CB52570|nr:XRE family transcriptional regulator [uncultured Actinomyces sp.]MBF0960214.1 XRE family transcriptional regulator [Actinomyces sp.]